RRAQLILHDGNELSSRAPVFLASQNSHLWNLREVFGDFVLPLLTNGKLRNSQNDFIGWPGLIQQRVQSGLKAANSIRDGRKRNNHSFVRTRARIGQDFSNERLLAASLGMKRK